MSDMSFAFKFVTRQTTLYLLHNWTKSSALSSGRCFYAPRTSRSNFATFLPTTHRSTGQLNSARFCCVTFQTPPSKIHTCPICGRACITHTNHQQCRCFFDFSALTPACPNPRFVHLRSHSRMQLTISTSCQMHHLPVLTSPSCNRFSRWLHLEPSHSVPTTVTTN